MKQTLTYQNQTIQYEFIPKKVKNINLRIKRDGTILITCHPNVPKENVLQFVYSKWEWIIKAQNRVEKMNQIQSQTEECDSIRLFGKVYPLVILKGTSKFNVNHDHIVIQTKDPLDYPSIVTYIEKETKKLLVEYIEEKRKIYDEMVRSYGLATPIIQYRKMRGKWGSCLVTKSIITMNTNLIYYPKSCIDYVLLHEYAHLVVPNHSNRFYQVIAYHMPNYQQYKKILSGK